MVTQRISAISLAALLLAGLAQPTPAPHPTLISSYQAEGAAHDGFIAAVADDAGAALPDPIVTPVEEPEGQAFVPEVPTLAPTPAVARTFTGEISAYCLSGRMANGEYVHHGAVAADWSRLPHGTRLRIAGLPGIYTVKDRGGAIYGTRVDVWMESCGRAREWGRRWQTVEVLLMG